MARIALLLRCEKCHEIMETLMFVICSNWFSGVNAGGDLSAVCSWGGVETVRLGMSEFRNKKFKTSEYGYGWGTYIGVAPFFVTMSNEIKYLLTF